MTTIDKSSHDQHKGYRGNRTPFGVTSASATTNAVHPEYGGCADVPYLGVVGYKDSRTTDHHSYQPLVTWECQGHDNIYTTFADSLLYGCIIY